jgi:ankyrin repeat protein
VKPIAEEAADGATGGDNRTLGIFLNQREELVVGKREHTGGTLFSQLKLTPLAEACALGNNEIAEELLSYGSNDTSGLACRIAHLSQDYDLMQHMLSRCCSMLKRDRPNQGSSSTGEQSVPVEPGLKVSWNNKKLPEVKGEWFTDSAVYYVDKPRDTEGDAEEEKNFRRAKKSSESQPVETETNHSSRDAHQRAEPEPEQPQVSSSGDFPAGAAD